MSNSRHRWRVAASSLVTLGVVLVAACVPDAPDAELPTGPSDRFSVMLAWDAPTTDADGNPLADLSGYRLYYIPAGSAGDSMTMLIGDSTQVTVTDLPAGSYAFAVTALDRSGNESDFSDPLNVEVGP